MRVENDYAVMDDGTSYYAHGGILGIYRATGEGMVGEGIFPTTGWDGGLVTADGSEIPPEHRLEIAEYIIGLWKEWAGLREKS